MARLFAATPDLPDQLDQRAAAAAQATNTDRSDLDHLLAGHRPLMWDSTGAWAARVAAAADRRWAYRALTDARNLLETADTTAAAQSAAEAYWALHHDNGDNGETAA